MKTLVIVESPTKAVKIQEFLGKNYIVKASKGHIADLATGGQNNLGIDIDNGFKTKYVLMPDKMATLNMLLDLAKECDNILLFSDADREGEAIAWHLLQRLEGVDKPIKRITSNEIKKDKILKAIKNARDIDMNLFHSQEARRILDRIVGFMASPFLMNTFGDKLSAGRVQSVVTKMIVDREKEIGSFSPEDFWTIHATLSHDNTTSFEAKFTKKILEQNYANNMLATLSQNNPTFVVSQVIDQEEKVNPQPPLITSTLQRVMSKIYNIDPSRTMKAAQALYESGYCTYIRTDSVRASDEALKELKVWLKDNSYDVPAKENVFKNKNATQDAHECIRPSDLSLLPDNNHAIINPDEKKVYEVIWKYFVASQMKPAIYSNLKISLQIPGKPETEVRATGKALKYKGYLEIFNNQELGTVNLPSLAVGDSCFLFGKNPVKLEKKQTQPPPRYSEDKLIKELENKSIGRPATYAELLSKITNRNYVEKNNNVYCPTELGMKITKVLDDSFSFMNYDFTAQMESQLDEIEQGKVKQLDMLNLFYPKFKKELDQAYMNQGKKLCPQCKSPLNLRHRKSDNVAFYGCSAFPKCKFIENTN